MLDLGFRGVGFRTTYLITAWELCYYCSIHCGTVDCLIIGLFAIRVSLGKRLTTAAGTLRKGQARHECQSRERQSC